MLKALAFVFILTMSFAHAQPCQPGVAWRTTDDYRGLPGENGIPRPRAIAAWKNFVYVAGHSGKSPNNWLIRRSHIFGEGKFITVDRPLLPGLTSMDGAAGIAVDQRSGHVYAAGRGFNERDEYWIVRKSVDNGETWTTVDMFLSNSRPLRVAVDHRGFIYVVGTGGSSRENKLRRSINGGRTWKEIPFGGGNMKASAMAIARDGSVFVAGAILGGWRVRYSHNGINRWGTVDNFIFPAPISESWVFDGSANRVGNVVFAGMVQRPFPLGPTWVTRTAFSRSPAFWRFLDLDNGSPWGVTSSELRGEFFVTGSDFTSAGESYKTRKGNLSSSSWITSDFLVFRPRGMAEDLPFPWGAAGANEIGDVFTAQGVNTSSGPWAWVFRKLSCSF